MHKIILLLYDIRQERTEFDLSAGYPVEAFTFGIQDQERAIVRLRQLPKWYGYTNFTSEKQVNAECVCERE